jgi:hypothetical protein
MISLVHVSDAVSQQDYIVSDAVSQQDYNVSDAVSQQDYNVSDAVSQQDYNVPLFDFIVPQFAFELRNHVSLWLLA